MDKTEGDIFGVSSSCLFVSKIQHHKRTVKPENLTGVARLCSSVLKWIKFFGLDVNDLISQALRSSYCEFL